MRSARSLVLFLLVVLLPALAGHAQVTSWNRQVSHILLDETTTADFYDVRVRFDVLAADAPSSTPSNLDTEVEVSVNSVSVGSGVVSISVTNATPGSCTPALCAPTTCGGGSFDGTSDVMGCRAGGSR